MRFVRRINRECPEDTRRVFCMCAFCGEYIRIGDRYCDLHRDSAFAICEDCALENDCEAEEVA